jgi:hypothetical protein
VDNIVVLDRSRLNTVSCLLAMLVAASNASVFFGAVEPWHSSRGREVLQLLEQYVRTALLCLTFHCEHHAAGEHSSLQQPEHQQQRQAHTVEWAETDSTLLDAGMHLSLYRQAHRCCVNTPGCLDAGLNSQLFLLLPQLFSYKGEQLHPEAQPGILEIHTESGTQIMFPAPLLPISCAPGAMQQQLLSLLFSIHKRVQGVFSDKAYAVVQEYGLALCQLQAASDHAARQQRYSPTDADLVATRVGAETAAQMLALLGRSLVYVASRLQHQLQQATVHVQTARGGGGRSSSGARAGRQRRAGGSAGQAEADLVDCLHELTMNVNSAALQLHEAVQASKHFEELAISTRAQRRTVALNQLMQLVLEQQEGQPEPGELHQQDQDPQQQQQQQVGHLQAGQQQQVTSQPGQQQQQQQRKELQLPPEVLLVQAGLHEDVFDISNPVFPAALIAQQVAAAASIAAARVFDNTSDSSARVAEVMHGLRSTRADTPGEVGRPNQSERQQLAAARSASDCLQVLLACREVQQLPHLLQATGERLCAAMPVPSCCNNPVCTNMSGVSELQLVQGRAAKRKACGSARCET